MVRIWMPARDREIHNWQKLVASMTIEQIREAIKVEVISCETDVKFIYRCVNLFFLHNFPVFSRMNFSIEIKKNHHHFKFSVVNQHNVAQQG